MGSLRAFLLPLALLALLALATATETHQLRTKLVGGLAMTSHFAKMKPENNACMVCTLIATVVGTAAYQLIVYMLVSLGTEYITPRDQKLKVSEDMPIALIPARIPCPLLTLSVSIAHSRSPFDVVEGIAKAQSGPIDKFVAEKLCPLLPNPLVVPCELLIIEYGPLCTFEHSRIICLQMLSPTSSIEARNPQSRLFRFLLRTEKALFLASSR